MLVLLLAPFLVLPVFFLEEYTVYIQILAGIFFLFGACWWVWFMHEWKEIRRQEPLPIKELEEQLESKVL